MVYYFVEGLNRGISTTPVKYVDITFSHPNAARFALDNLSYSVIPGGAGLPDVSDGGFVDEAESGIYQNTGWDLAHQFFPGGAGPTLQSKSEAAEAISAGIGIMRVGGADTGGSH